MNALDSFNIRCRLLPHVVPSPAALLVTGVNVADLTATPLSHFEMMRQVRAKINEWCGDGAIFVGWNSLRFDESMLRQAYYQTLLPVYQTNINGNGRADVMRMVQVASACLPNCLNVPLDANGKLIFKLGFIAEANDIHLDHAHEALADTGATLGVARLLRQGAPRIWDALITNARKSNPLRLIENNQVLVLSETFGGIHCRPPSGAEFTWEGDNEMDEASGDGLAEIKKDGSLTGEIRFHNGDDSTFKARRW